ncbi:MAG TPA: energy transducer TonB [Desulfomonilia bacterium]|nr:energy transducer TonB [Desulfomonilia bacterium]
MTWRPSVCYAVSTLMHLLFLTVLFAFMSFPVHTLPQKDILMVNLVKAASAFPGTEEQQASDVRQVPQAGNESPQQAKEQDKKPQEAGMSFETKRRVGAGYLDLLGAKINHVWKYPNNAIQLGKQGKVSITFILNGNGEIINIRILNSSGSSILDNASIAAIRQASPFGPLPKDSDNPLPITGHFLYVLD